MNAHQLNLRRFKDCCVGSKFDFFVNIVFVVFIILAIRYQIKLLDYLVFGDEAETIVAAKMMASGQKLYSEIFNHHGPLTFLPGVVLEFFGNYGVYGHRVPIAIFQIFAVVSIYCSPLFANTIARKAYTVAAATVMLLFFPDLFGSMYMYQVMAGLVIVIILVQYTLPIIAIPEKISNRNIILGNVLIGCLPFLGVIFAPIAFLLFLSSIRKRFLIKSFCYLSCGFFANVVFLACVGSIAGFFAFHIYMNSEVLPLYNGEQSGVSLIRNAFLAATGNLANFVIFSMLVAAISRLSSAENRFPWRSIFVGLGVASLLIRGLESSHGLPYYYSCLAMVLIFFIGRPIVSRQSQLIVFAFIMICLAKLSLLIPGDKEKLEASRNPVSTDFSRLVQSITDKSDRIIVYSFNNLEYIAADRLPASGYFFYLPWQEKYNENPKFGIKIDACKEISEYRPKIMLIDKWKVWGQFTWESYASCIQGLLDKEYIQYPGRPYYIRKDIAYGLWPDLSDVRKRMEPSAKLEASSPIKIHMNTQRQEQGAELKRIGIRFGTHAKENPGEAELHLKRLDGSDFVRRFPLSGLADNQYRYFDLDSKSYMEGEIVSISGGGVSTWETHDEKDGIDTCILYEYVDGNKMFTPGCPL